MKKAVIYARYSSERQTEQSIEGQLRVCHDYAKRNDIIVVETYIDRAMTGTNDNRRDFQRMMRNCSREDWDMVLVYKLDRFSRNKYEMAMHKKTLRDNGIKLVSCMENIPETPEGIILESLLEGMAEYYSAELSQKVRRGLNESRQKGLFTGGTIPYGYKVENKRIVVNEEEAQIVRQIFDRYAGGEQMKRIIQDLNDKGITIRGRRFAKTTTHRLLTCEKYIGIYRYGNEVFYNTYPAIVSADVFNIIKEKIECNRYGVHDIEHASLLKRKVYCGKCGHIMSIDIGTSKTGEKFRYYRCTGKKRGFNTCNKKPICKEALEKDVLNVALQVIKEDSIEAIADFIVKHREAHANDTSVLKMLEKEKTEKETALANLVSALEKGISSRTTQQRLDELEARLDKLEELIAVEKSREFRMISRRDIIKYLRYAITQELNIIYTTLIEKVVVFDKKVEIYFKYCDAGSDPEKDNFPPLKHSSAIIPSSPPPKALT